MYLGNNPFDGQRKIPNNDNINKKDMTRQHYKNA